MDEDQLDPEEGREVAAQLRKLGVRGILITAAELGHSSELSCTMPTCRCPEELGGKGHFVNVPEALPEWIHYRRPHPTQKPMPHSKAPKASKMRLINP